MTRARILVILTLVAATLGLPGAVAGSPAACAPRLQSVRLAVPSALGGVPVRGSVRLSCATSSPTRVRLLGSKGLTVPRSVLVPGSTTRADFRVVSDPTGTGRKGTVTAVLDGVRRSAPMTTEACRPRIAGLEAPPTMYGGDRLRARLRLTCAVASRVTISLGSSSPATLRLPSQVRVAAGRSDTTVPLTAPLVATETHAVRLTAALGRSRAARSVAVYPGIAEAGLGTDSGVPQPVLRFTGPVPPEGVTVGLRSSSAALTVPATYRIPGSWNRLATIPSLSTHPVQVDTPVKLTLTLGSRSLTLRTVLFAPDGLTGMSTIVMPRDDYEPPGILYGGEQGRDLYASLSPAAVSGPTVAFTASGNDEGIVQGLDEDQISSYDLSAWTRFDVAPVTRTSYVVLHARHGDLDTLLPVTVHPGMVALELPATTTGGGSFPITIRLAGPADDTLVVRLWPQSGGVRDLGVVKIPAGQSSVTVEGFAVDVDEPWRFRVEAVLGATEIMSNFMTIMPSSGPARG